MIAIDFETYYDKKQGYGVDTMGADAYARDDRFRAQVVSVVGEGIRYAGTLDKFDWRQLHGKHLCAHNAGFDQTIFEVGCQRNGQIPADVKPASWTCTADLVAYMGCMRGLGKASNVLLGRKRDKSTRDKMNGLTLADARGQGLEQEFLDYVLQDSIDCLELWEKYHDQWPELEQKVSRYNRDECRRGVMVDVERLEAGLENLYKVRFMAEQMIPWDWSDNKTPLSPKKLAAHCREIGVEVPASTDRTTDACKQWLARYGDEHPFLQAVLDWRRANTMINKLNSIRVRIRPDGSVPIELKYFGAHTGRFSGGGGVNMQNLNRGELMGVQMRWLIRPREGCLFFPADLSQIEPRTLAVLSGNDEFLALVESGESPYEAHARLTMGWTGGDLKEENPTLYQFAKARLLSLGYGAGWAKFIEMAAGQYLLRKDGTLDQELFDSIFRKEVSGAQKMEFTGFLRKCRKSAELRQFENMNDHDQRVWVNSWLQVSDFRAKNPKITNLWRMLDYELKLSAQSPERKYEIGLPNGRTKTYWNVTAGSGGDIKATAVRAGPAMHLYGGLLCENLTQAVARDVFVEGYVSLIEAGYHIPFTVHDENVVEAPSDTDPEVIAEFMRKRPAWFGKCPLDAEVKAVEHYEK